MKKKAFRILARKTIYRGRAIKLSVDKIKLKAHGVCQREIIEHAGSSVMIPELRPGIFLLVRQFRYAASGYIWEFPAGTISKGETPLACARRELEEETGYRAGKLIKLMDFYPSPGVSNEIMHLYLARGLRKTQSALEEDEFLEVHSFSGRQIGRMIESGAIRDAKTILGFYELSAGKRL